MPPRAANARQTISIHAPPVGSDRCCRMRDTTTSQFQSTLPLWGATSPPKGARVKTLFQSTLPLWGATFVRALPCPGWLFQSTLPLWGATCDSSTPLSSDVFQSTLPLWGATGSPGSFPGTSGHFNPRSPCGERQQRCTDLGAHLWRSFRVFVIFYKLGEIATAESNRRWWFFGGNGVRTSPGFLLA